MDLNTIRKPYIQYLLDNELNYGFATFWNANVTSELSNGRIEIAGLDPRIRSAADTTPFSFPGSLMPLRFFDAFYHEGESFLLLNREEWDFVRGRHNFSGVTPNFMDANFVILLYPSAEIIHRELIGN
jgi:hypothetical protein